jgi:hypothetical protein
LGEEGRLFSITVCIEWLRWHLEAAPDGGIPDIDGARHGYAAVEAQPGRDSRLDGRQRLARATQTRGRAPDQPTNGYPVTSNK